MSIDKPTGDDGFPDRSSGAEDKPFPGAPENREPAPAVPANTLSMEDVRAAHQRAGSNAEFEAAAKAHAQAGSPDSPGPDSSGEGLAEADGEGAAPGAQDRTAVPGPDVPGGRETEGAGQTDGFLRPEGFARPDRAEELPPFPGAPEDREPAPVPASTLSMEDVRAAHQRAGSNAEFEAMAAEDATAAKDASASKPGSDTAAVRDASSRDPAAEESGEQRGEETDSGAAEEATPEQPVILRAPPQEMPAAEMPDGEPAPLDGSEAGTPLENQPDARHEDVVALGQGEDAEAEPAPEGIEPTKDGGAATRSDAAAPETDDKPVVAGVVEPDRPEPGLSPEERETGDTNATRSEVRLDSQSDDQRPVTRAEMMAMLSELEARHRAEIDAVKAEQKAEHEAEIDSLKADYDAKFDELKVKVEEGQPDGETLTGRKPDSDREPHVSDAERRSDRLRQEVNATENAPDNLVSEEQGALIEGREGTDRESDANREEPGRWRRLVTSKSVGAAGTVASAVNAAAMLGVHASPESIASLGIALVGAASLGIAKLEKRRKEKDGRQH